MARPPDRRLGAAGRPMAARPRWWRAGEWLGRGGRRPRRRQWNALGGRTPQAATSKPTSRACTNAFHATGFRKECGFMAARRTGRANLIAGSRVASMRQFDVVVCGLGATGSAALYQLARRGMRVLGIERFLPGHDRGSFPWRDPHHPARLFRASVYVPLVRRAIELWREIEAVAARAAPPCHRHSRDRAARRHAGGGNARLHCVA